MAAGAGLRQPSKRVELRAVSAGLADLLDVIGLGCRLPLHIDRRDGRTPKTVDFVIDSGASYSIISLALALGYGLPVPPPEAETDLPVTTAGGSASIRVRPGRIRCWWTGEQTGYPFDWPVLFRVDAPFSVPPILGLGGVVKTCRWTFDGSYTVDSPYGCLTLDDTR